MLALANTIVMMMLMIGIARLSAAWNESVLPLEDICDCLCFHRLHLGGIPSVLADSKNAVYDFLRYTLEGVLGGRVQCRLVRYS